ncbi:Putative membrane protein [Sphingopyxis fribergensis]|jgi:hypothetical protein|uniref:Putative membrane protein n=1 Tax=Sphingopyxis fribergensis TaxID=1515612 RepID=A0A0A7PJ89_9SPHN|nr:DUF6118 family protein [Sphingopyxis fribergensis]AJA09278.1 Putative membrane protein [Sphingopyxis fribergensis]
MDDDRQIPRLPYDDPGPDPATEAFARLEREMAMMRRAVEHLATEKSEIDIPDYSKTLGEMANRLVAIERQPAMQMTPEDMVGRIATAATEARREDQATLAQAKREHVEAARGLRAIIGTANTLYEQKRRRWWHIGGGLFAGCLLWAVLPGFGARILPTSWHLPERIAARTVREPTLWEAGIRIMQADSPEAWQAIAEAAEMRRDNREAINACVQRAAKSKQPVRCTISVRARQPRVCRVGQVARQQSRVVNQKRHHAPFSLTELYRLPSVHPRRDIDRRWAAHDLHRIRILPSLASPAQYLATRTSNMTNPTTHAATNRGHVRPSEKLLALRNELYHMSRPVHGRPVDERAHFLVLSD